MNKDSKIYVAGHTGLVGSAIMRKLIGDGYQNIVTRPHVELDLRSQADTERFFAFQRPEYVFLAAARVGGIKANDTYRADFIYDNIVIAANIIHASYKYGVVKLLNLGSSCIYPKKSPQPIKEESLLSGYLETTNEPYAIAKIAAIKLCESYNIQHQTNFISVMPTNLYGPNDNYDLETSHVAAALIRRFHEATLRGEKRVTLWGTGKPRREFLYSDDLANAVVFLMQNYTGNAHINIGYGDDITIKELATNIAQTVGFTGALVFDRTMPSGIQRKLLDSSKVRALGWKPLVSLSEGLSFAYNHFLKSRWAISQQEPVANQ